MKPRDIVFHKETEVYFWILSIDGHGARLIGKDDFLLLISLQQLHDDFVVKGNLDQIYDQETISEH